MEKAILAELQLPFKRSKEIQDSLAELARLSGTAGIKPAETVIQRRDRADPAYYIGRGKAEEIKRLAAEKDISTVIFDEDLKPAQQKNLEELTGLRIIDRTRLILDIFAQRARSKEGLLQVELARINYLMPRITERFGRFEQQTGGLGGARRGPGERKLEVDLRHARDRIAELNREIDGLKFHRDVLRKQRVESGGPGVVAIVGYTNAGKSTLLNLLSGGRKVYADDKLFATLDPTTRKTVLPSGRQVLFTDTVGFINKLPHTLIAAFRATLEEIAQANCVLLLTDISHPAWHSQFEVVESVLKELGAGNVPRICAFNKADALSQAEHRKHRREGKLLISARTGQGVTEMLKAVDAVLTPKMKLHRFTLPYALNNRIGEVFRLSVIKKQKYTEKGVSFAVESTHDGWEKIKSLLASQQ